MKERPILFSAPMVRALLAGTKTQTRRVIRDASGQFWDHPAWRPVVENGAVIRWDTKDGSSTFSAGAPCPKCPYGQPGDRLWVKETAWWGFDGLDGEDFLGYVASEAVAHCPQHPEAIRASHVYKKPSLFMRRDESRITLEITCVRVERLQDISDDDARAEGVAEYAWTLPDLVADEMTRVEGYRHLWESINGPESWKSNPWVWVVEFKVVTK